MSTVVLGEASESEDEVDEGMDSLGASNSSFIGGVKGSPTASLSSRESSILAKSGSDGDAMSDVPLPDVQSSKVVIQQKYKSIFQKKLVEEMFALRGQAESMAHKSYNDSTRQVKQLVKNAEHLTNDLKKSAYQLQLLTNDLFRLEDKLDEVNQQMPLSNLVLPSYIINKGEV